MQLPIMAAYSNYSLLKRPNTFLSSLQEKPLIQIYFPLKSTKWKGKKQNSNNNALCNSRQGMKSHTINHLTFAIYLWNHPVPFQAEEYL